MLGNISNFDKKILEKILFLILKMSVINSEG